ncbi:MAG: NOP5/NOP56 family protein [Candidatus Diapherotrites archaeon]
MPTTNLERLRKQLISKAKKQISEKYSGDDIHIIRAVNVLEDLDFIFNLLSEHAREWYSVHFPELNSLVKDNETYLKMINDLGTRENFTESKIEQYAKEKNISKIAEKAKSGMGSEIGEKEMGEINSLVKNALSLKKERNALSAFIEKETATLMPNFSELAGPILSAKLLNEAGSFKKLAMMPSSTMQLLGAEKALFRHIKSGARPPKYGHLFQHPLVKQMTPWQKGATARTIAGKLSMAIKEDYFGDKKIAEDLKKDLEVRLKEISETHKKKEPKEGSRTDSQTYSKPRSYSDNSGPRPYSKPKQYSKPRTYSNKSGAKPFKTQGNKFRKPFKKKNTFGA